MVSLWLRGLMWDESRAASRREPLHPLTSRSGAVQRESGPFGAAAPPGQREADFMVRRKAGDKRRIVAVVVDHCDQFAREFCAAQPARIRGQCRDQSRFAVLNRTGALGSDRMDRGELPG